MTISIGLAHWWVRLALTLFFRIVLSPLASLPLTMHGPRILTYPSLLVTPYKKEEGFFSSRCVRVCVCACVFLFCPHLLQYDNPPSPSSSGRSLLCYGSRVCLAGAGKAPVHTQRSPLHTTSNERGGYNFRLNGVGLSLGGTGGCRVGVSSLLQLTTFCVS